MPVYTPGNLIGVANEMRENTSRGCTCGGGNMWGEVKKFAIAWAKERDRADAMALQIAGETCVGCGENPRQYCYACYEKAK